jgi:hypothetical protein
MTRTDPPVLRAFAAIAALVGWGALILQLAVLLRLTIADGRGVSGGIVAYLGFFTILTNILAALTLSAPLVAPDSSSGRFLSRAGVNTAVAAAMALVGIAYSLLLRHTWNPQGWQLVADEALHDVMPVLFLTHWWFRVPKGAVRWTDIPRWCAYPIGYLLYALVRGALIGRYPYPFIDVGALGYRRVLVNSVGLLLGFTLIALILVGAGALKKDRAPSPDRS